MNDASVVNGFERGGHLPRDAQRLGEGHRALRQAAGQCLTRHQLHHDERGFTQLVELVHVGDVRMTQ